MAINLPRLRPPLARRLGVHERDIMVSWTRYPPSPWGPPVAHVRRQGRWERVEERILREAEAGAR